MIMNKELICKWDSIKKLKERIITHQRGGSMDATPAENDNKLQYVDEI